MRGGNQGGDHPERNPRKRTASGSQLPPQYRRCTDDASASQVHHVEQPLLPWPVRWTPDDPPNLLVYQYTQLVQQAVYQRVHQLVNELPQQLQQHVLHCFRSWLRWLPKVQPQSAVVQLDRDDEMIVYQLIRQVVAQKLHPDLQNLVLLYIALMPWVPSGVDQHPTLGLLDQVHYDMLLTPEHQWTKDNPPNLLICQHSLPVQLATHQLVHQVVDQLPPELQQQVLQLFRSCLRWMPEVQPQQVVVQLAQNEEMIVHQLVFQVVQQLHPDLHDELYMALLKVLPVGNLQKLPWPSNLQELLGLQDPTLSPLQKEQLGLQDPTPLPSQQGAGVGGPAGDGAPAGA